MMMMFNYLHPQEVEGGCEPLVNLEESILIIDYLRIPSESTIPLQVRKGYIILNEYRRVIQLHMAPQECLYLYNPFDEASSSYEIVASLGKERFVFFLLRCCASDCAPPQTSRMYCSV